MKDLTPEELKLTRKCVSDSLALRATYVATYKKLMETTPASVELKVRRKYMKFVATEIPQLTALLQKLKGGKS